MLGGIGSRVGGALLVAVGAAAGVVGAGADTCAVPAYREHRPGPWPPLLPTSLPVGQLTDSPWIDGEPAPAGRWLTFYRLGEPAAGTDPLGILLSVRRQAGVAVIDWGGGGDPAACCLPGGCEDLCPLECLARGGLPSAAGLLCSDPSGPCAVDPCGALLDFTGNEVPAPWFVLDRDGNTNETTPATLANERLEAAPTNSGQRVEASVAIPAGVTALVIEFDSQHLSSQWGCYAEMQLHSPAGMHAVLARNAIFSAGPDTMELWTQSPSGVGPATVAAIAHAPHHHRMLLTDGWAERQVWDLGSGALVADLVQELPGFLVSDVERLVWEVYVTTQNPTWGDGLRIDCLP